MGATLSSVPLCSRADPATDDNNNVDTLTDNNLDVREVNANMIVAHQPAPAPVETSTPKIDREREIERDLGESDNPDSLEFGPTSDKTFGSDSGLDHSSDEQEMSRYNIDDDYLDTVLDTEDEDEEEVDPEVDDETQESLESGDLGIDDPPHSESRRKMRMRNKSRKKSILTRQTNSSESWMTWNQCQL